MTDARPAPTFPTTSGALAAAIGAELLGAADISLDAIESSERARPGVLTFARSAKYVRAFLQSSASAALVSADAISKDHAARQPPAGKAILVVPSADLAIVSLLDALSPRTEIEPGVHPTAIIASDAAIASTARVEAHAVVESGVTIGERSSIGAGCVIGRGCRIGQGTIVHPRVVMYHGVFVGDRCLIHAGCVLGADGFGFVPAPGGRGLVKIPHVGSVEIHDDVEIGSNTTIDRGKFGATLIGQGTKIDNLCQIGHNCRIGRMCIICGMSGLAGSVVLGDGVIVGAMGGIADNLTLGPGAKLAGGSNARENIPAGETWMGHHARPVMENLRSLAAYQKLNETTSSLRTADKQLVQRIEALDEELRSLHASITERGRLHAGGRHD